MGKFQWPEVKFNKKFLPFSFTLCWLETLVSPFSTSDQTVQYLTHFYTSFPWKQTHMVSIWSLLLIWLSGACYSDITSEDLNIGWSWCTYWQSPAMLKLLCLMVIVLCRTNLMFACELALESLPWDTSHLTQVPTQGLTAERTALIKIELLLQPLDTTRRVHPVA